MTAEEKTDSETAPVRKREVLRRAITARSGIASRAADATDRVRSAISHRLDGELTDRLTEWPTAVDEQVFLERNGPRERGDIPRTGSIVLYVHGYLGEGRLPRFQRSGAHQAAALTAGLQECFDGRRADPPSVLAGMWSSSTSWYHAKRRTRPAGETLARWLDEHHAAYDSVTILAHSLGARVTLHALTQLETDTVDTVGLLGAAVRSDAVCTEYRAGIESSVADRLFNYYSRNDAVVCRLYQAGEFHRALGCHGSDCSGGWFSNAGTPPRNLIDVDVSETVVDHLAYYKPESVLETGGNCLDLIVANQLSME